MTDWAFRTMITTAATTPLARSIASTIAPETGQNMWITPLSATGNAPATHYVSTGLISDQFAALMPEQVWTQDPNTSAWSMTSSSPGDPVLCRQLCLDGGLSVTQAQINNLYATADVTQQEPFTAFGRLDLKLVHSTIEEEAT